MKSLEKIQDTMKLLALPLIIAYFLNSFVIIPNFELSGSIMKTTHQFFNISILIILGAILFYQNKSRDLADTIAYFAIPIGYLDILIYIIFDLNYKEITLIDLLFLISQVYCFILIAITVAISFIKSKQLITNTNNN